MVKKSNIIVTQPNYLISNSFLLRKLHLEFCKLKKKSFILTKSKASVVKYPLFHRRVIIFNLRGIFRKKHFSKHSMCQTITLECLISKNKVVITSPTNPKGITIY